MAEPTGPLVSVIMPVYNGEAFLRESLNSALAQTFRDFEIVVVDDGSTDASPAILDEFGARVRVVREGRSGCAGQARNRGVREARGRYLAFLDHDDLWLPEKLARQVEFMERHPQVGLSFTSLQVRGTNGVTQRDLYAERPSLRTTVDLGVLFEGNVIFMPTPMLRREIFDAVGGFDSRLVLAEDYHLWLKVALVTRIGFIPEVLGVYRLHGSNSSGSHVRMLANEHRALALLASENSEVGRQLGHGRVRRQLSARAYAVAYKLRELGQAVEAHEWTLQALRENPFDLKNYLIALKYVLAKHGLLRGRAVASK